MGGTCAGAEDEKESEPQGHCSSVCWNHFLQSSYWTVIFRILIHLLYVSCSVEISSSDLVIFLQSLVIVPYIHSIWITNLQLTLTHPAHTSIHQLMSDPLGTSGDWEEKGLGQWGWIWLDGWKMLKFDSVMQIFIKLCKTQKTPLGTKSRLCYQKHRYWQKSRNLTPLGRRRYIILYIRINICKYIYMCIICAYYSTWDPIYTIDPLSVYI